jgi:hypothetical protein
MTDQPGRYRRCPAEIEAVQWTDTNADALTAFVGTRFMTVDPEDRIDDADATASLRESAHECWSLLRPGDWVVKRGNSVERVGAQEFADLYEPNPPTDDEREDLLDTYRQMIADREFAPLGSLLDGALRFLLGEVDRLRARDAEQPLACERIANRLDQESARRVKAAWSPEEAVAAREWGNVAAYVRGLTADPHLTAPDDPGVALANHIFSQPLSVVQSALRYLGWPITFEATEETPRG